MIWCFNWGVWERILAVVKKANIDPGKRTMIETEHVSNGYMSTPAGGNTEWQQM